MRIDLLERHVPPRAVEYCYQLWKDAPFELILRKRRLTKLGDFTCRPGHSPRITLNADSHPFVFLLTYVHEVAHLRVHREFGFRVPPHGKEWKNRFRELCSPLLLLSVFPETVKEVLMRHLQNPSASSFSDPQLLRVLRDQDSRLSETLQLADIPEESRFMLHGRWYQKGKLKRTRVVCKELASGRNYLISAHATVGGL
jgi:SprT protein